MAKIHIGSENGQSSQYEEEEVKAMLRQGALTEKTLYWKQGMTEWKPLSHLFPPPVPSEFAPPALPAEHIQTTFTFAKDPHGLTRFLKIMLWIQLAFTVLSIGGDFSQLGLAFGETITEQAANANDMRQAIINLPYFLVMIITGIAFLKWIYRANLNCRGFGAEGMAFTPGWSIGFYFIPIANLFKPYQAMKEIWKVSADPRNWKSQPGDSILPVWWTLWIVTGVLNQITTRLTLSVDSREDLQAATIFSIIGSIFTAIIIVVAVKLISRIIDMQARLVRENP